jgi:hypothetical protein
VRSDTSSGAREALLHLLADLDQDSSDHRDGVVAVPEVGNLHNFRLRIEEVIRDFAGKVR